MHFTDIVFQYGSYNQKVENVIDMLTGVSVIHSDRFIIATSHQLSPLEPSSWRS